MYLSTGKDKYFAELWRIFRLLCLKAVRKERKEKGFFLDIDEEAYKTDIAAEYSLRRYYMHMEDKGETYYFTNFISEAYHAVQHALYCEGERDTFLDECRKLDGKPVEEVRRRGLGFSFQQEKKADEKENDGQLELF